jgi:hypothetical protein
MNVTRPVWERAGGLGGVPPRPIATKDVPFTKGGTSPGLERRSFETNAAGTQRILRVDR